MINKNDNSARKEKIKAIFTKNIALKIISFVFAMILWGYVMMDQDPMRNKTINNIDVSFEGEADMISRKLIIRGDRKDMISDITARVSTNLTNYADLSAEDVQATVSVRSITSAGEYELPIYPSCTNGNVESVTPTRITVEIDNLVTKRIPVEYRIVAGVPDGYWAGSPTLSRSEIDIQGAETDITPIVKGICFINLSARTESYNEAMTITLMNADEQIVDESVLYGQVASVSVQQAIWPTKSLTVDVTGALRGADNLASNFEIAGVTVTPGMVDVAGSRANLDAIESLTVEDIDIAGRNESLLATATLLLPEGVTLLPESNTVSVYVDIREKLAKTDFAQMPVKILGETRGTTVRTSAESLDMTITGRTTLINRLDRADVQLYVDVTDLSPGTYTLQVQARFPSEEMKDELEWTLSQDTLSVTIRKK